MWRAQKLYWVFLPATLKLSDGVNFSFPGIQFAFNSCKLLSQSKWSQALQKIVTNPDFENGIKKPFSIFIMWTVLFYIQICILKVNLI